MRGSLDIPSHTQLTPYPWCSHDSNQFVLICRTGGEGAETRGWAGRHELHQHQRTQDAKEKAACCSCPYNTSIVIIRGHVFMTRRRRRCTCARESTRPSACEAATCAPTVREGGKIGRDEHPLDCSAKKHCGYLPPTRQPPSAPAKYNHSAEVSPLPFR